MNKIGILIANLAALCWGYVYSQTENIMEKMSPLASLSSFYVFGGIFLFPLFILNKKEIVDVSTNHSFEFFSTAIAIMIAEFLIIYSIKLLGGVEASFIEISYPLWTVLFSFFIFRSLPNINTVMGGILIMIGSYFIAKNSGV